jgi:hypothetical protein
MTALLVIEGIVILMLLILVAGLLKSHAEILRQLHRLGASVDRSDTPRPPGVSTFGVASADRVVGTDLSGAERTVSLTNGRSPTLLAFLSSGCATCRSFWEELHHSPEPPLPGTRTVVVTKGTASESPGKLRELAPTDITLLMSDEYWDRFRVPVTPYFLLVDREGNVLGEGSARNWDHLLGLLRQSISDTPNPAHLDTTEREEFTDSRLRDSGIQPGDDSLYRNPIDP